MQYLIFDGELNSKNVGDLIDFVQNNDNKDEDLTISFCSGGGNVSDTSFLAYVLNQHKERITLIGSWSLYSSGFELFYKFKGLKKITEGTQGMVHYHTVNTSMSLSGEPQDEEQAFTKLHYKKNKTKIDNWASQFLNDVELKKFKKNKSVFLSFERMLEIFSGIEVID